MAWTPELSLLLRADIWIQFTWSQELRVNTFSRLLQRKGEVMRNWTKRAFWKQVFSRANMAVWGFMVNIGWPCPLPLTELKKQNSSLPQHPQHLIRVNHFAFCLQSSLYMSLVSLLDVTLWAYLHIFRYLLKVDGKNL